MNTQQKQICESYLYSFAVLKSAEIGQWRRLRCHRGQPLKAERQITGCDLRWANLIDRLLETLPEGLRTLTEMRYFERKSNVRTAMDMCIERSTYYAWLNSVLTQLQNAAVYIGLLPDERMRHLSDADNEFIRRKNIS